MNEYNFVLKLKTDAKLSKAEIDELFHNFYYRLNGYTTEAPSILIGDSIDLTLSISEDTKKIFENEK